MTRNRTNRAPIKHALIVAAALAGTAWMGNAYGGGAVTIAAFDEATPAQMVEPADSDRRFDLLAYGDRFKLAIKAGEEEAKKPHYGWSDCGEDDDGRIASND